VERRSQRVVASFNGKQQEKPAATWPSNDDTPDEEGSMTPEETRELLGLSEDATDEQVQSRRDELAPLFAESPEQPDDEPEENPDEPEEVAPEVAANERVVTMDRDRAASLERDASMGRVAREAQLNGERDGLVKAAVDDGRLPPSARKPWRDGIQAAANADAREGHTEVPGPREKQEREALASLETGRIPVDERGSANTNDESATESTGWFPALAQKEA